ncbi:MAG: MBL fold metallo-hydrolase [Clostridia bacterium]|nr:MBL fold metallo-hydrolase [Clostridia bacterium]
MFTLYSFFPGVTHIQDEMGVCFTLLCGEKQALLFDCGYGTEDVHAFVRTLTSLPLVTLLSHGHHDHALGARWFERVYLHPEDLSVYRTYTGLGQRKTVLEQAHAKGLAPKDFLSGTFPEPQAFDGGTLDLGGLHAEILHAPGHTPGSLVCLIPEIGLLLPGDNWNPETWCFFPEAPSVHTLAASLQSLLSHPFDHVLCPHATALFTRDDFAADVRQLTREALFNAVPTDHGVRFGIQTRALPLVGGHRLVFDYGKAFPDME